MPPGALNPFERGVIRFDVVVSAFLVDVFNGQVGVTMAIHGFDNGRIGRGLIGDDGHGKIESTMPSDVNNKGFGIASGGEPEFDKASMLIDYSPQIKPLAGDLDIGICHKVWQRLVQVAAAHLS